MGAQVLPLAGDRGKPLRWLALLLFVPSAVLLAILCVRVLRMGAPAWLAGSALLGPLLLLDVLYLFLAWRIRCAGVALNPRAIGIDTGFSRRLVALQALAPRGMKQIDLKQRPDLRPLLRTLGLGLPGFSGGWYRLRNGRKALCLVTAPDRVTLLEDETGLVYLISLADPEPLRRALQAAG